MNRSSKQPKWNVNGAVFYLRITWGTVYTQKLDQKSWCQLKNNNMTINQLAQDILRQNMELTKSLRDFGSNNEREAYMAGYNAGIDYAKRIQDEAEVTAYNEDHDHDEGCPCNIEK